MRPLLRDYAAIAPVLRDVVTDLLCEYRPDLSDDEIIKISEQWSERYLN
jgi:hypothetical protein